MRALFVVFVAIMLAGCATEYSERSTFGASFFGGVSLEQVGPDTYRVFAQGNAYTSPLQVRLLAFKRAANQARAGGFDGFRVIGGNDLTSVQGGTIGIASAQGNTATAIGLPFATAYPAVEFLVRVTNDAFPVEGYFRAADFAN